MIRGAAVLCAVVIAVNVLSCGPREPRPGTVKDEAMRAGVAPEKLVLATPDYFRDMDFNNPLPKLSQSEIEGRNMWMVWTGGNDRLWDRLTVDSLGTFDLLKSISSHPPTSDYKAAYGLGKDLEKAFDTGKKREASEESDVDAVDDETEPRQDELSKDEIPF